jgi:hypothetical protein
MPKLSDWSVEEPTHIPTRVIKLEGERKRKLEEAMTEKNIHSYSSPLNVGHKGLSPMEGPALFDNEVYIQEKVDGSQFSFMRSADGRDVFFRSRKQEIYPEAANMFRAGVTAVLGVADMLEPGWVYRGEYLAKPKHNTLCYDQAPRQYVVLYDIESAPTHFLDQNDVMEEASRLGFDYAPVYFTGKVDNVEQLKEFLNNKSILGGPIEGIVIKPVGMELFGADHKVVMAKYVREDFKETHQEGWKKANPTKKDIIEQIIERYRTPQRWNKAVQHLREAGELEGSPKDIGKLFVEVPKDIGQEHKEEIKNILWNAFWKDISRGCTAGLAEWYKNKLVENAFEAPGGHELPEGHPNREERHAD